MPYIYKITNTKNGKVYIGKTLASVEARWNEHCKDCKRQRCEKRPLYSAMNKYGVESFTVETLEECKDDILSEREQYWIELYGSFKYGYNATRGGDGKIYVDYDMVAATYIHIGNIIGTAERLGLDVGTVRRAINARGCKPLSSQQLSKIKNDKKKVSPKGYVELPNGGETYVYNTCRATEEYKDRYNLAYLVDKHLNPGVEAFFAQKNISIDKDNYSLSELIQWLFRSRLRNTRSDDRSINLYIPSQRMRGLLEGWLDCEPQLRKDLKKAP